MFADFCFKSVSWALSAKASLALTWNTNTSSRLWDYWFQDNDVSYFQQKKKQKIKLIRIIFNPRKETRQIVFFSLNLPKSKWTKLKAGKKRRVLKVENLVFDEKLGFAILATLHSAIFIKIQCANELGTLLPRVNFSESFYPIKGKKKRKKNALVEF